MSQDSFSNYLVAPEKSVVSVASATAVEEKTWSITQALHEQFETCQDREFTGTVYVLAEEKLYWKLFFCGGNVKWAVAKKNQRRGWYRHLNVHCGDLLNEICLVESTHKVGKEFPHQTIAYGRLVQRLQAKQVDADALSKAVNSHLAEVLFDILQEGSLREKFAEPELTFKAQKKSFKEAQFLSILTDKVWQQAQSDWKDWQEAGLLNCSPALRPVISKHCQVMANDADHTYQDLAGVIQYEGCLRDMAVESGKPLLPLALKMYPFIQQGEIGLVQVNDFILMEKPKASAKEGERPRQSLKSKTAQPKTTQPKKSQKKTPHEKSTHEKTAQEKATQNAEVLKKSTPKLEDNQAKTQLKTPPSTRCQPASSSSGQPKAPTQAAEKRRAQPTAKKANDKKANDKKANDADPAPKAPSKAANPTSAEATAQKRAGAALKKQPGATKKMPSAKRRSPKPVEAKTAVAKGAKKAEKRSSQSTKPLIVYIEDSQMDSRRMQEIVQDAGFRYFNIHESIHAIPLLIEKKPQLIFLDLVMPIANGYEICAQIRRVSLLKKIPVVIVTSNDGIIQRIRTRLRGASGFVSKPIQRDKVLKLVNRWIQVQA